MILDKKLYQELLPELKRDNSIAKGKLIKSCLKLIKSIAKKYDCKGVEYVDLVAIGVVGLTKCIENIKWDNNLPNFFSTAQFFIEYEIYIFMKERNLNVEIRII